jgi:hypothetical protein
VDVCVLTADNIFFSAVEGIAGAMGHLARRVEAAGDVGSPDLLVIDHATAPPLPIWESAGVRADPLRTAVFAPPALLANARATGAAHVHLRTTLAVELPRILAQYVE